GGIPRRDGGGAGGPFSPARGLFVRARAGARRGASSTVPPLAVTRKTRSGCCFPNSCLIWFAARDDSDDGSSKPPLLRREATPPPRPAATRKNTTVPTSTDLRRATEKRPSRASTAAPDGGSYPG